MDGVRELFSFPNPVNERAARTVAAGVVLLSTTTLILSVVVGSGWLWLSVPLAIGFLARVLSGPTLSPLGQLATRVIAPRLGEPVLVAGPPKRFAQAMGLIISSGVVVLHFAGGFDGAAEIVLVLMIGAAVLESAFAYCIGCRVFAGLMRLGVIPQETCAACANVALRWQQV